MNRWTRTGLVGLAAVGSMGLGSVVAFAGTNSSPTYNYPSTIKVTITSADPSLQPVPSTSPGGLKFYFSDVPVSFTPTGSDGQVTFSPSGVQSPSVTVDPSSMSQKYVYDVAVPTDYQTSSSSHLYVVSNYQWEQEVSGSSQPIDNYSTLENLVQQLPEVPFALAIPAAVGGVLLMRRKKSAAKVSMAE